jgi:hypothetical protein
MTPWRLRALTFVMIFIGGIIVGIFGLRTFHAFRGFREHGPPPPPSAADAAQLETDVELIREWMTIPFVAKMYHLRPHVLFEALDIPEQGNREKSLQQLNEEYYPESDGIVMEMIKATILAYQAQELPAGENNTPSSPIRPIGPIPP